MSEPPVYIFNPEHDLCLANGDQNFVPPASASKFGRDCAEIVRIIGGNDPVAVWGWDSALRHRLIKSGISKKYLPSDEELSAIRELSHRRVALEANAFVLGCSRFADCLLKDSAYEIFSLEDVFAFLERSGSVVLKAPWSGSGKGLRWVRRTDLNGSDTGWCRNVIASQGSVMAERRQEVVVDFAVLFSVGDSDVLFEGFSLFYTRGGAYRGNVLASNDYILKFLNDFVPAAVIMDCVGFLKAFLMRKFLGRYRGFVGVDMFICEAGSQYFLAPCVEVNVRMTMGLLARRYYDNFFEIGHSDGNGRFVLEVVKGLDSESLASKLSSAEAVLTVPHKDSRYAVAVFARSL